MKVEIEQCEIIEEALRILFGLCVTNIKVRKRVEVCQQKIHQIRRLIDAMQSV